MPAYDSRPTTDADILACLSDLPALPRPHWSWPYDNRLYSQPELMEQVIRVLGAGAIQGRSTGFAGGFASWHALFSRLAARMKAVAVRDVVINLGCWGQFADPTQAAGTQAGQEYLDEIRGDLTRIRDAIATESTLQAWPLRVACIWIDQEALHRRAGDDEWNRALAWVNNETLRTVRSVFGRDPHVVQHARGLSGHYNRDDEHGGSYSVELYNLDDTMGSWARYREACAQAAADGVTAVYPVLAFGGHYRARFHAPLGWQPAAWHTNHAWRWGSWLNDPYFRAKSPEVQGYAHRILLWPRCLPASTTVGGGGQAGVPAYGAHLVAYCCGAHRRMPSWIAD